MCPKPCSGHTYKVSAWNSQTYILYHGTIVAFTRISNVPIFWVSFRPPCWKSNAIKIILVRRNTTYNLQHKIQRDFNSNSRDVIMTLSSRHMSTVTVTLTPLYIAVASSPYSRVFSSASGASEAEEKFLTVKTLSALHVLCVHGPPDMQFCGTDDELLKAVIFSLL